MSSKKFSVVILVLLAIACSSPLVTEGKTENLPNSEELSPMADNQNFLPFLSVSPSPPIAPTPIPTTIPLPSPTPSITPIPPSGDAVIADHTVIAEFSNIPEDAAQKAAEMKVLFMHQSTGNNIEFYGFRCLAGERTDSTVYPQECLTYALNPYDPFDWRSWAWKLWDTPMSDGPAKTDQWVSVVNARQQDYEILGMKFCYVDGWNLDFEYYREKMEQLENTYPQKTFIWSTSVLWSEGTMREGNASQESIERIQAFNQQLRDYALANDKFLYDPASIESRDSNGNFCEVNGNEALCDEYDDGGGGHPNVMGSIRLAKGFWWLIARIGGWDGIQE